MAGKEIKQRIVLEGEKEYNQAIKDAQRNLRTLKSELKAETAELGANATAQQKNEAKAKSLRQQIAEQEKVVKTLKEALAEAREQYGDNENVVQSWEQKLNNARTTLANMRNELQNVGTGMQGISTAAAAGTVATKSLADAFGKIAEAGQGISDKLESIFGSMVNIVKESIGAVWTELMDLAARSNEWGDIAGMWNTDAANVEKWARSTKAATGDFNAMLSAVQKINDLSDAQQKKVAEFAGVSGVNYADRWEYAMAVLDSMSKMDYDQQLKASEEIFGAKRAGGILDILNDWQAIQDVMSKFDAENGGLGLDNAQIEQLTELDVKVATIKETWQAFVDSFMAEHLAKLGLDLTGNAQVILEDLIKYLDTGSDEDLAKLEEDITAFFDRVVAAIQSAAAKLGAAGQQLEDSDNGIVSAIGKAMTGLSEALQWLAEPGNIDKVVQGFEALAAFWLLGKGASLVSTIASLAANFKVIGGSGAISGLSGGAGAFAGGGGLGGLLAGAGYLAVGIMMVAPSVQKLFDPSTWKRDPVDEKVDEVAAEVGTRNIASISDEMEKGGGPTQQQLLRAAFNRATYTSGDTSGMSIFPDKEPEAPATPGEIYGGTDGVVIPRAGTHKLNVTAEQKEAAEVFWDAWKEMRETDWENEGAYDQAWANFEKAFEGNTGTFDRLNDMMERLWDSMDSSGVNFGEKRWQDLPSEWWQSLGSKLDNGVTSEDLAGLRGLPAATQKAVQAGAAAGVSGIRVTLDGRAVGELVAPYVSTMIARSVTVM